MRAYILKAYSGKLPTYPTPKPTITLTSHLAQNVGFGEERWVVSQKPNLKSLRWRFHMGSTHDVCIERYVREQFTNP